jgi:predicted membrane GTPase involved in stress response
MHRDLPLEQLVKRRGMPFQLAFAREAKELIPPALDVATAASHKGLHVLAQNEESLARPVTLLREVYGSNLVFEPPQVRLIEGAPLREPIMHLRIRMRTEFRETVKQALWKRGAVLTEAHVRATHCVLRYEAPLADLLGFPAELARLAAGTAEHWILLSHYAIVVRDPGGQAA